MSRNIWVEQNLTRNNIWMDSNERKSRANDRAMRIVLYFMSDDGPKGHLLVPRMTYFFYESRHFSPQRLSVKSFSCCASLLFVILFSGTDSVISMGGSGPLLHCLALIVRQQDWYYVLLFGGGYREISIDAKQILIDVLHLNIKHYLICLNVYMCFHTLSVVL